MRTAGFELRGRGGVEEVVLGESTSGVRLALFRCVGSDVVSVIGVVRTGVVAYVCCLVGVGIAVAGGVGPGARGSTQTKGNYEGRDSKGVLSPEFSRAVVGSEGLGR